MKKNHVTIAGIAVVVAMIAGIMLGVRSGNAVLSVFSFLAGAALLYLLKRSVDTVIEDEWTDLVERKSATLTMNATAFIFTVAGLFLITVSGPEQNYDQAVYAIAAFLVTLSVLQVATTVYYSKTLRGSGP